jgi:hypothetical protein
VAIDERAIAAFRELARQEWEEFDRILTEARERGDQRVLIDYGRLAGIAHLELTRRQFPDGQLFDIIRYVARNRRHLNMHPSELDPRVLEQVIISTLSVTSVVDLTNQGYTIDQIGFASMLVMSWILQDAKMDQAEVFDRTVDELRPRVEAVAVPEELPEDVAALLEHSPSHDLVEKVAARLFAGRSPDAGSS